MGEKEQTSITKDSSEQKLIEELPILPLKNGVVYPNAIMPITIGQERSIKLIDDVLVKDKIAGIVSVKNPVSACSRFSATIRSPIRRVIKTGSSFLL